MRRLTQILFMNAVLILLVGCVSNADKESTKEDSTELDEVEQAETDDENEISVEETSDSDGGSPENSDLIVGDKEDEETLSEYSSKQIEYARIWLQLGPNQEIDELNVRRIPAGEPINPNDDTSASYPIDVIQLAGSRLVDGSVTYSGNGDGTIHVYNVPLRWESDVPEDLDESYMSDYTKSIINDAQLVYVDPGEEEDVIKLIKVLNIH